MSHFPRPTDAQLEARLAASARRGLRHGRSLRQPGAPAASGHAFSHREAQDMALAGGDTTEARKRTKRHGKGRRRAVKRREAAAEGQHAPPPATATPPPWRPNLRLPAALAPAPTSPAPWRRAAAYDGPAANKLPGEAAGDAATRCLDAWKRRRQREEEGGGQEPTVAPGLDAAPAATAEATRKALLVPARCATKDFSLAEATNRIPAEPRGGWGMHGRCRQEWAVPWMQQPGAS